MDNVLEIYLWYCTIVSNFYVLLDYVIRTLFVAMLVISFNT
jgi:hypothetical protein